MRYFIIAAIGLATSSFATGSASSQTIGINGAGISITLDGPLSPNNDGNEPSELETNEPDDHANTAAPPVDSTKTSPNTYLQVIEALDAEGYIISSVERSWFNRIIVKSYKGDVQREIVVSQSTGLILRDLTSKR